MDEVKKDFYLIPFIKREDGELQYKPTELAGELASPDKGTLTNPDNKRKYDKIVKGQEHKRAVMLAREYANLYGNRSPYDVLQHYRLPVGTYIDRSFRFTLTNDPGWSLWFCSTLHVEYIRVKKFTDEVWNMVDTTKAGQIKMAFFRYTMFQIHRTEKVSRSRKIVLCHRYFKM